jgi:microsomal dipeptidase-like Zn-dependent dipeptidase
MIASGCRTTRDVAPRFETRNVEGLESISKLPNLARQMRVEGFSAVTIAGTLGENFLRVFQSACG